MFGSIIGQTRVKEILKRTIEHDRLAHAYLFHGPEGCGKDAVAIELIKIVNCSAGESSGGFFGEPAPALEKPCGKCPGCVKIARLQHPDLQFIFPTSPKKESEKENKERDAILIEQISKKANNPYRGIEYTNNMAIRIDDMRDLKKWASFKAYEAKVKAVLISDADTMLEEASNALLKLLEEPPDRFLIVLTSARVNQILPTIISRCQQVRFEPLRESELAQTLMEKYGVGTDHAKMIATLSRGNFRQAYAHVNADFESTRKQAIEFLRKVMIQRNVEFLSFIETISKETDKNTIQEILVILILWFRDIVWARESGGFDRHSVNVDFLMEMKKFSDAYPKIDFENVMGELEKSIRYIDRNVGVQLVLIGLGLRLRQWIRRN